MSNSTCVFVLTQLIGYIVFDPNTASAQQIVIQQPVIQQFHVDTVVSVPDRGAMFLGGVGRNAGARNRFGFSPIGSSVGRSTSASSASAHVRIHDFEEMDAPGLGAIVDGFLATLE